MVGALATPRCAAGQRLGAVEAGLGVTAVARRHTLAAGELALAWRPGGQSRVALAAAAGSEDGSAAARAQLTAQYLVSPAARAGLGLYGGIGLAVAGRRGTAGDGYLAVVLGVERAPGRRAGWYVELGLAGGVRAAVGWRARRFPGWWR